MRKLVLVTILSLFAFSFQTMAQNYNLGIGIRTGYFNGLTVKKFTGGTTAIEGLLTTRWNGFTIAGLLEFDNAIADVDGLSWFYGFGGHVGFWENNSNAWYYDPDYTGNQHTVIGLDGILGLEWTIPNAPLSFQLDWKPEFHLIGATGFRGDGAALSIRYAIK